MKRFFRIAVLVMAFLMLLTGCNKIKEEEIPSINVTTMEFNYDIFEELYPDYEHAFRGNMYATSEMYNYIYRFCNEQRALAGLDYLKFNKDLTVIAGLRTLEIVVSEQTEYIGYDNINTVLAYEYLGFDIVKNPIMENICEHCDTAEDACQIWLNDTDQYNSIINPDMTQIGIGISYTEEGECVFIIELM